MAKKIISEEQLLDELTCSEIDAIEGKMEDKDQVMATKGKKECPL